MSDKIKKAHEILNYPGLPGIRGEELLDSFKKHQRAMGLEITEKQVTNIVSHKDCYMVLAENEVYESRTVALCMGVSNLRSLPGEELYLGRGVSYCASCDGVFYKGREIGVFSTSPHFEKEVHFLAELASGITLFPAYKTVGMFPENVTISKDFPMEIEEAEGKKVLKLHSGASLGVDGVFLLREAIAPTTLLKNLEMVENHILVDKSQKTSYPGCYAAGDCTGRPYQYAKAVGEGNVAAHGILEYLDRFR